MASGGMCDKQVSIDTFSKEAKSTVKRYLGSILKRVLRWQKETGVQVVLGKDSREEVKGMFTGPRGFTTS